MHNWWLLFSSLSFLPHSHPRLFSTAQDQQFWGGEGSGPHKRAHAPSPRRGQQRGAVDGKDEHGWIQWHGRQQQYPVIHLLLLSLTHPCSFSHNAILPSPLIFTATVYVADGLCDIFRQNSLLDVQRPQQQTQEGQKGRAKEIMHESCMMGYVVLWIWGYVMEMWTQRRGHFLCPKRCLFMRVCTSACVSVCVEETWYIIIWW